METPFYQSTLKPIKRSKLRLWCGRKFYSAQRYLLWYGGGLRFARRQAAPQCVHTISEHATPLLRKLKDVDMQYQYNKITNLRLAAKRLDGVVIRPGETFSYWRLIGNPNKRKGYLKGIILFCGTFRPGTGGGLCQMSNLIFWMTLHTPLTIVERYRHSYDVFPDANRTQPFGSGATCVYPYRDLMIRNNTQNTYRLNITVGDEFLEGSWTADRKAANKYVVIEKNHSMKLEYWGGYSRHNELFREIYDQQGNKLSEEFVTRNDALMMYSPFLEQKQ